MCSRLLRANTNQDRQGQGATGTPVGEPHRLTGSCENTINGGTAGDCHRWRKLHVPAMPDPRTHRGAHPEDAELFGEAHWPALQIASAELAWLLDRGYALRSSLALTGDRHQLTQRQRLAVARSACSRSQSERRAAHLVSPANLAGTTLWIDGYNLLITIEAALAGGVLLLGRDDCLRDMASLHGTYRVVAETAHAARLIGAWAAEYRVAQCQWVLDRPVANSGRLRSTLLALAEAAGWPWDVQLEFSPDAVLAAADGVIASTDSVVLDRCTRWCNAAREIVRQSVPAPRIIELSGA